jgi:hypothetical protein
MFQLSKVKINTNNFGVKNNSKLLPNQRPTVQNVRKFAEKASEKGIV